MIKRSGFTFIDLILAIGIIGVLVTLALLAINPLKQLQKARDSKRKSDLATLQRVLEDWYNDKGCYPKAYQIGYGYESGVILKDNPKVANGGAMNSVSLTFICGREKSSPDFRPYLEQLPCSPTHNRGPVQKWRTTDYAYEIKSTEVACPQSYKIYSNLENLLDPIIRAVDCMFSTCGPSGKENYQYGVASPNSDLNRVNPGYTCRVSPGVCNKCGTTLSECNNSHVCLSEVYTTANECCTHHPCP